MRIAIVWLTFLTGALAQTSGPVFEVASIKPVPPTLDTSHGPVYVGSRGGPGTSDPGRFTCTFCDVADLVEDAYNLPSYRVSSGSPLPDQRYDVVAKVPQGTQTRQELQLMLQNLLAERFKLAVHRESREMQMFRLVVAAGGPKLKVHAESEPQWAPQRMSHGPGVYYRVQGKTMADFAKLLAGRFQRPVSDETGLSGTYDFDVWWAATDDLDSDATDTGAPTLRSVIQSLGLKLESQRGPVEVVVVDHVEKAPTEN